MGQRGSVGRCRGRQGVAIILHVKAYAGDLMREQVSGGRVGASGGFIGSEGLQREDCNEAAGPVVCKERGLGPTSSFPLGWDLEVNRARGDLGIMGDSCGMRGTRAIRASDGLQGAAEGSGFQHPSPNRQNMFLSNLRRTMSCVGSLPSNPETRAARKTPTHRF